MTQYSTQGTECGTQESTHHLAPYHQRTQLSSQGTVHTIPGGGLSAQNPTLGKLNTQNPALQGPSTHLRDHEAICVVHEEVEIPILRIPLRGLAIFSLAGCWKLGQSGMIRSEPIMAGRRGAGLSAAPGGLSTAPGSPSTQPAGSRGL